MHIDSADEDRIISEETIKSTARNLRYRRRSTPKFRNRWRKQLVNELKFLRESFPHSDALKEDYSDISLLIEKE